MEAVVQELLKDLKPQTAFFKAKLQAVVNIVEQLEQMISSSLR